MELPLKDMVERTLATEVPLECPPMELPLKDMGEQPLATEAPLECILMDQPRRQGWEQHLALPGCLPSEAGSAAPWVEGIPLVGVILP